MAENANRLPPTAIPRWRGFNLMDFFWASDDEAKDAKRMVSEEDCRWISDWGFDFIRLPMDYRLWIDSDWRMTGKVRADDTLKFRESMLEQIDRAVEMGRAHGLHVDLNFHRGPGYCCSNRELDPFVLWSDSHAEDVFVRHWEVFAKRYRGIPSSDLSFNLLNEPSAPSLKPEGYMKYEDHTRVMTRTIEAIRAISPDRTIIIDGYKTGNWVVKELIPLGVAQSCRGYVPREVCAYKAPGQKGMDDMPLPTWPLLNEDGSVAFGRAQLQEHFAPWGDLAKQGIGVICGEAGCFNQTPHDVCLSWHTDFMEVLKTHGIGYAIWTFRGGMGLIDTNRPDVDYEDWYGHKLDRKLLSLLQQY